MDYVICHARSVEPMSHCPYLLLKFVINYLFDYYSVCLVYSSYRRSISLGGCSPAPQGCYTYMIMIIKMIEIHNIAAQPYYWWWTHAYYIETITPCTPLTVRIYHLKEDALLPTHYAAVRISNCLKIIFVIKVATTDDFCNKWKPSCVINTFCGEQRWMGHKGGPW